MQETRRGRESETDILECLFFQNLERERERHVNFDRWRDKKSLVGQKTATFEGENKHKHKR